MKRFWLFGGEQYYANGGMVDFIWSFESLDGAVSAGRRLLGTEEIDWWHVFDIESQAVASESDSKPFGFSKYPKFASE